MAAVLGGVLDTVRGALGMAPASYHVVEGPQGKQFVWDHGRLGNAVDSEFVPEGERNGDELEALAVPPMELTATVPDKHEEGEKVTIAGPHGPMEVVPPKGAKPGSQFTFRLTPMYEFRVEVPPGAKPGLQIECTRRDGVRIAIGVPPNLKPGDFFEVLPPAIIVRVPDDAKDGWGPPRLPPRRRPGREAAPQCRAPLDPHPGARGRGAEAVFPGSPAAAGRRARGRERS
ncbi:unnamed protein product, partial [Prorocentrum cordatum]